MVTGDVKVGARDWLCFDVAYAQKSIDARVCPE